MKKKILLLTLASFGLLLSISVTPMYQMNFAEDETPVCSIDVGKAETMEEQIDVAARELTLNTDLDTIVTDITLPTKGLYTSVITWASSDEDHCVIDESTSVAKITRPAAGSDSVHVDLTATLTISNGKENTLTRTKVFALTILPKKTTADDSSTATKYLNEDFSSYALGDDIAEYLAWDLNSGTGQTEVVSSVPNNDMVSSRALKVRSQKNASEVRYVRDFYATSTIAMEGYAMIDGEVNGIHFDLGVGDSYGPSFGLKKDAFMYYSNGDAVLPSSTFGTPTEDVWYKFRIEANTSFRTYSISIYTMDGSNTLVTKKSIAYATSNKYLNKFRIRIEGGDKTGSVYLSDIKMGLASEFTAEEGTNPNRKDGIGTIDNFSESVLFQDTDEKTYDTGFAIHNRFDASEIYTESEDYTLTKETTLSTEDLEINAYHIVLLSTGETKDMTQTVYKSSSTGLPSIENFKGSHLAQKALDASGTLSSTGTITFSGVTSRKDGTIYYGLKLKDEKEPTEQEIKDGGTAFVASGSFVQSERDISFDIADLALANSYDLYVFMENANGVSEIYAKKNISTTINITTCEEFYDMTVNVNTYQNEFRLENDLDFSSFTWPYDPTNLLKWKGSFDGQGHTITNLTIASPGRKAAIFSEISNGTVKNLNIVNPQISGLQDTAVICGYSNGATISNITITNADVSYNNNDGSEGYFGIVCGRLFEGTTNMDHICITNAKITCNKYTGTLTGNVNKDHDCVLNATNIYCETTFNCEGAAVGLIGRNRGTSNLENVVAKVDIQFAKKEMGIVAGHNKEGGKLNVKKLIGTLSVDECSQPTYFNYFIGSHDANTSSYTFEDVYFIEGDFSSVTDNFSPINTSRTCGTTLSSYDERTARWWEENTFIESFETDSVWSYDASTEMPKYTKNKVINVTAEDVNSLISKINGDFSKNDHYYIRKARILYAYCSDNEKAKVNKADLDAYEAAYNEAYASIQAVATTGGLR